MGEFPFDLRGGKWVNGRNNTKDVDGDNINGAKSSSPPRPHALLFLLYFVHLSTLFCLLDWQFSSPYILRSSLKPQIDMEEQVLFSGEVSYLPFWTEKPWRRMLLSDWLRKTEDWGPNSFFREKTQGSVLAFPRLMVGASGI